jgi:hypothetical protein
MIKIGKMMNIHSILLHHIISHFLILVKREAIQDEIDDILDNPDDDPQIFLQSDLLG